jgi:uncharacterized protein (TIGR03086 family)
MTGCELLRGAIHYAVTSAELIEPPLLTVATPCSAWNLGMLLVHLSESMDAITEGLTCGMVALMPAADAGGEPGSVRARCARLLAAIPAAPTGELVGIADLSLTDNALAYAGAMEVAVHGWDIAVACGRPRPIPAELASPLLKAADVLLPASARPDLFAHPLRPPVPATPSGVLLAFLGRREPRCYTPRSRLSSWPGLRGLVPALLVPALLAAAAESGRATPRNELIIPVVR